MSWEILADPAEEYLCLNLAQYSEDGDLSCSYQNHGITQFLLDRYDNALSLVSRYDSRVPNGTQSV